MTYTNNDSNLGSNQIKDTRMIFLDMDLAYHRVSDSLQQVRNQLLSFEQGTHAMQQSIEEVASLTEESAAVSKRQLPPVKKRCNRSVK